jgi:hypothetical protein
MINWPLCIATIVASCILFLAFSADVRRGVRTAHPVTRHEAPKRAARPRALRPEYVIAPMFYDCEFCGRTNLIGQDCIGCGHPQTKGARTR